MLSQYARHAAPAQPCAANRGIVDACLPPRVRIEQTDSGRWACAKALAAELATTMSVDAGFIAHLQELLEPLGQISMRRMFGGHGVYCNDVFFAIVIDDQLYVKVDAESRPDFIAAGCAAFVYTGKNNPVEMSYWSVPGEALDSAAEMRPWAQRALAAALRKPAVVQRPGRRRGKTAR